MSEPESNSTNDEAYEQLVAYLDGELDAETSKQVERRLTENVEYRRELQQLQRAWDMLDELPRAEVGNAFTRTTVEIVVLSAAQELTEVKGAPAGGNVCCGVRRAPALCLPCWPATWLSRRTSRAPIPS